MHFMGYLRKTNKKSKKQITRNKRSKKTKTARRRTRRGGVAPPQQNRQNQQQRSNLPRSPLGSPPSSPPRLRRQTTPQRPQFMEPEPTEVDMGDISVISENESTNTNNIDDVDLSLSFDDIQQPTSGGKKKWGGRKTRKLRSRKYNGGSNVGCNNSDPNYSIYNTNMLQLFPYR